MRQIFVYKDDMVDLNKVAAIEFDEKENEVIFCMTRDWEYILTIDDGDIKRVKKELLEMFKL